MIGLWLGLGFQVRVRVRVWRPRVTGRGALVKVRVPVAGYIESKGFIRGRLSEQHLLFFHG